MRTAFFATVVFCMLTAPSAALTPRPGHVGFRIIEVPSIDRDGASTSIDVALFYPTLDRPSPDRYLLHAREITTLIARDGGFALGPHPLVVYSHGAGGCGLSGAYLCEELARAGFVVAAIDHTDQVYCSRLRGEQPGCRVLQLGRYALQVANTISSGTRPSLDRYGYRPAQVRDTIDHLLRESANSASALAGIVSDRVGIIGHSFGAWTTLISAGLVAEERHPKVRAAVSLSGVTTPTTFTDEELESLRVPIMIQAGSKEHPYEIYKERQYDRFRPPKVLVQIQDANHNTFAAGTPTRQGSTAELLANPPKSAIVETAVDFFRAYLSDEEKARRRLAAADYAGVSRMSRDLGGGEGGTPTEEPSAAGRWHFDKTFDHGGHARTYHFFETGGLRGQPRPLVMLLHGGGAVIRNHLGDRAMPWPFQEWFTIAEEEQLHLLVPQGINRQWNDCRRDCHHCGDQDDVGFLLALIDALSQQYRIDRGRVYSVGESNGGLMTLRLAQERPDRFAGMGVVIALMPANNECMPRTQPISIQFQVGTEDRAIPYAGGLSGSKRTGSFWSAEDTLAHWVSHNRCRSSSTMTSIPDSRFPDQSTVTLQSYDCPATRTRVQMYHINGGGHVPPSTNIQVSRIWEAVTGKQNHDIEGARVLWQFFQDQL